MASEDPYAVLGVAPDAGQGEITAAYRALVRRLHPDTPRAADPERLRQVIAAYRVLRDRQRRTEHDWRRGQGEAVPVRVRRSREHRAAEPDLRAGPVRRHGPVPQ